MSLANLIQRTHQKNRLDWYEKQIRSQSKSLATTFIELRDDPLKPWKFNHESYEEYCREVWSMSPRRLQQIAAGDTFKALLASEAPDLAPVIKAMPEGQVRELAGVPPRQAVEIIKDASTTPGKMTAAKIKKAKARVIDAVPLAESTPITQQIENEVLPPAAKMCPHCGKEIV